jgi:hypothetical protein
MRGVAVVAACLAGLAAACLAGCSSGPASNGGTTCGTTRTGAGVPVQIKVAKGDVACATAMSIETKYASMVRNGQVPGNGGGAPVAVDGWTCQGYLTPQILQTGDTSQCHTSGAEILAVLPSPSSSPSS